jgi:glucan phosphoethanolaminetransferase (alkaline phosphatase superfamily)
MTSKHQQNPVTRIFTKPLWWMFFLTATFLMSLWFRAFKIFTVHPNWSTGISLLLVMLLLFVNIAILAYDSYLHEKSKGNIHKPIRFFEWLSNRRFLMFSHVSSKDAA